MGTQRKKFEKGYKLKASDLNDIWDAIEQNKIISSPTVRTQSTSGGTSLTAAQPRGGSSVSPHPYKGSNASEGSVPKVQIILGTHNGVIPKIDGVPMSTDPTDNILTLGSSDQIVYIELDWDIDTGALTECLISSSADLTPPEDTDSTSYQILFFVSIDIGETASVLVTDNVQGSQSASRCVQTYFADPLVYNYLYQLV